MKYRKKPVVIEAVQWTGFPPEWIGLPSHGFYPDWLINAISNEKIIVNKDSSLTIKTLEGDHRAELLDYIILGVVGEMYPCKLNIFEMTYEAINE